ncbi:MAG: hypothetical protein ABSC19_05045 [Syntrophorhabdales bacterium]|jgi:hypothetical protein
MLKDVIRDFRKKGALWLMPEGALGAGVGVALHHHYKVDFFDPDGRLYHVDEFDNTNPYAGTNAYLNNTLQAIPGSVAWYVGLVGANSATFTGSMSASSATLTLSASGFTAADVGSAIIVQGAGASGADLITTISAYTSGTAVTLAASASTAVSTAKVTWGPRTGDTMASHGPWVEAANYSNSTRPLWTPNGASTTGSISNSSSVASFTVNAQASLFGAFMCSNSTVGGATGTLLGMGLFSGGSQTPTSGSTVNVTITCSMS